MGTLIVVNSVMAGFTREMHVRLHGILSDIIIESHSMDGLSNPAWHMDEIRKSRRRRTGRHDRRGPRAGDAQYHGPRPSGARGKSR